MATVNQTLDPNIAVVDPGNNGKPSTGIETTPPTIVSPELVVNKRASAQFIYPGEQFKYTITINNVGNAATSNPFFITDVLPPGITFIPPAVSSTGTVVNTGSNTNLNLTVNGYIPAGGSATITIPVQASNTLPNGAIDPNTAQISPGNGGDDVYVSDQTPPIIETPELIVTKKSTVSSTTPGSAFGYFIEIKNNSSIPTSDPYTVTDSLPNYITLAPGYSPTVSSGTVVNTGDDKNLNLALSPALAPNETVTIFIPVVVSPLAPPDYVGTNIAIVDPGNGGDLVTGEDKDTPVIQAPILVGSKSSSEDLITPGSTFNYTMTFQNSGNYPTTSPLTITDPLPPNVVLNGTVTSSAGVVTNYGTNTNLQLSIPVSLEPGESITITIPVRALSTTPAGVLGNNTATGSAGLTTTVVTDPSPPVVKVPVLKGEKVASNEILCPGESFNYTLTITNNSSVATANPFNITDNLPSGVYLSGTPYTSIGAITNTGTNTNLNLSVKGSIASGQTIQIIIPVTVSTDQPTGELGKNSATISPGNGGDPITVTEVTPPVVDTPQLQVIKTSNITTTTPGSTFAYYVYIKNNSEVLTANPLILTDILPDYLSLNGNVSSNGGPVTTNVVGQTLNMTIPTSLPPGGSILILIPVKIDDNAPNGSIGKNLITVDPGNGGDLATGTDNDPPTIQMPIIEVAKASSPSTVYPGATFTYLLQVTNIGNLSTSNPFTVTDNLPPGVTLASNPTSNAGTVTNLGSGQNLVLSIAGSIAPGSSIYIAIPVKVALDAPSGELSPNTATVDPGNNGNLSDGVEVLPPTVAVPELGVTKESNSDFLAPGQTFNYTITVTNYGSVPTSNPFSVTDLLPSGVTLSGAPYSTAGSVVNKGTNNNLNLLVYGQIQPGTTVTIVLPVIVNNDAPTGQLAQNTAVVNPGNGGDNASATDNNPPYIENPTIAVWKSSQISSARPGDTFNYVITIVNNSKVPTSNPFSITDNLPSYMSLNGNITSTAGAVTNSGNNTNLILSIGSSIPPDSAVTVTIPIKIADNAPLGEMGSNIASVYPDDTGNPTTGKDMSPPYIMGPSLAITKSADVETTTIGGTFNYIITITNNGNYPTSNPYSVTDQLPNGVELNGQPTSNNANIINLGTSTNLNLSITPQLQPGESITITVPVKVTNPNGTGQLDNNSVTGYPGNGGKPATGTDDNPPILTQTPDVLMQLKKSSCPNCVAPGGIITYKITTTNVGNSGMNVFSLVDVLPTVKLACNGATNLTIIPGSFDVKIFLPDSTTLIANVSITGTDAIPILTITDASNMPLSIPVGASVCMIYKVQVPINATCSGIIKNSVSILGSGYPVTDCGVKIQNQKSQCFKLVACLNNTTNVKAGKIVPIKLTQKTGNCINVQNIFNQCSQEFSVAGNHQYECCYRVKIAKPVSGKVYKFGINVGDQLESDTVTSTLYPPFTTCDVFEVKAKSTISIYGSCLQKLSLVNLSEDNICINEACLEIRLIN